MSVILVFFVVVLFFVFVFFVEELYDVKRDQVSRTKCEQFDRCAFSLVVAAPCSVWLDVVDGSKSGSILLQCCL